MSSESKESSNPNPLGAFVGLLGVLSIFLYFTGWIYRWAYFSFFELEITTLNLPPESFFLVPIQVFLGDFWTFGKAVLALLVTVSLLKITLWLLRSPTPNPTGSTTSRFSRYTQKLHRFWLLQKLRSFAELFPQPLRQEMVIVAWILAALFWFAQWQGLADARRDAVNQTTTRPVVTLISSEDKIALGRKLDDLFINPSLKGNRIIGDVEQFKQILGRETNDTTNREQPIVWRLLIEQDNWVYLFPALPPNSKPNQHPPVLAIQAGDGRVQLLILSRPIIRP